MGQPSRDVLVYGNIKSSDPNFRPFSYTGIMYTEHTSDGGEVLSASGVNSSGEIRIYFPRNIKVELHTFYENYYDSDTVIVTNQDSIYLAFIVHPKQYTYTEEQAKQDISNGVIQLITYDSVLYNWNNKVNYSSDFGFQYVLLDKPDDFEFSGNIDKYNYAVGEYLDSKDSLWYKKIYIIEDSLINLEADDYGKNHELDLSKLIFSTRVISQQMKGTIDKTAEEFKRLFKKDEEKYRSYTPEFILEQIDNNSDYHFTFIAKYWIAFNYESMIPELVKRITNRSEVGLKNTADLIIWERVQSGDLPFYGHGGVAFDDLFTVAGRANHLLKRITGRDFGSVSMYSTDRDLKKLQNRWVYWLMK